MSPSASSTPVLVPTPPPSVSDRTSDVHSSDSEDSSRTTTRDNFIMATEHANDDHLAKPTKRFGSALQQFSQDLTKTLNRYQISEKLTDKNFSQWSQPILEALISLEYVGYVKKSTFKDSNLTDAEHRKVKFIITTWMLGLMDVENARRSRAHLTTRSSTHDDDTDGSNDDSDDDSILVMSYEPALLWKFLRSHHQAFSESSLSVIDETLHVLKITSSDSIVTHMDKFDNLMLDYYM